MFQFHMVRSAAELEPWLSQLVQVNSDCFNEAPWHQRWDNSPDGTDPSVNGYAFFRSLSHEPGFLMVVAAKGDELVGFGCGLLLTPKKVESLNFGRYGAIAYPDGGDHQLGTVSDYYQACVGIAKHHRQSGMFPELVNLRLEDAAARHCKNVWVRTHYDAQKVIRSYEKLGFRMVDDHVSCDLGGVPSRRVVMCRQVLLGSMPELG